MSGTIHATRGHGAPLGGYSRFVVLMKVFLPVVAVALITLVLIWPHLQFKDARFRIGFSALTSGDTNDPSMINPRYIGTDEKSQAFSVTADIAKNLLNGKKSIELEMPKADISLEDGSWLVLTAKNGIYERVAETLQLKGSVNMFHDSGYEFKTESADIDLATGIATGLQSIEGQGPFGTLKAEGFKLFKNKNVILFTGKSRMTMYPANSEKAQ
ncbi:MAG: LPS export ABC transporter periplasmic protein LptC [Rhodospirillaceae bacterium]|nr:LPS export ABC transporter periplasmic protein LptC [Rhodospirillaceae bacterium]